MAPCSKLVFIFNMGRGHGTLATYASRSKTQVAAGLSGSWEKKLFSPVLSSFSNLLKHSNHSAISWRWGHHCNPIHEDISYFKQFLVIFTKPKKYGAVQSDCLVCSAKSAVRVSSQLKRFDSDGFVPWKRVIGEVLTSVDKENKF